MKLDLFLPFKRWKKRGIGLLLPFFFAAGLAHGEIINVFLIGGQSNADGRARPTGLPTSPTNLQNPQNDVPFYYGNTEYSSNGLIALQPGTSEKKGNSIRGFGPEITFGRSLANFYAPMGQTVALLKYAAGGTSLYSDWKAGGDATTIGDGVQYTAFQNTINAGLLALQNAYPTATILLSGMLWVQGETDIDDTTSGSAPNAVSNYAANLTALISDLRQTYNPSLNFFFSRISKNQTMYSSTSSSSYQNYLTLRKQQALVASTVANAYMINTDGSSFTTSNPISGAGLHYDATGQQALGNAFANQVELLVPEPSASVLLLGSAFWVAVRRRRR